MSWGGFILTNAGRNLLAKAQAGTIAELNITRFGMGDGSYSGSYSTITNLASQKQSVPLRSKKAKNQYVNIEGYFSNEGLAEGFYFREWGIFAMNGAQEILYAYDNSGTDAEYIAPDGSIRYEKLLKAALAITADVNVTINTSGVVYVTAEELEEKLLNISSKAADISIEDTAEHFASDNVEGALAELFQSVSDGKELIADAITDKGVQTSATDTFQDMADNIADITTDPSIGTTDALAADLLSGKKAVSKGNLITGTMPNRGTVNQNLTSEGQEYTVPAGYHSGLGKIKAVITGLVASVIKYGATVGGIEGNFTGDANATAGQMLKDVIAYVKGVKIVGTIPSKTAQNYTPGTTNQTIASGQYLSGAQIIEGSANLLPENIKSGVNIFGKVGALKPASALAINATHFLSEGQGNGPVLSVLRTRGTVTNTSGPVILEDLIMKAYFGDRAFIQPLDNDVFFRNSDSQVNSNPDFNRWYKAERGVKTQLRQAWRDAVILNMPGGRVQFSYDNGDVTISSIIEKP